MKDSKKIFAYFMATAVAVFNFTGCDLINPPKKDVKKAAAAVEENVSKTAAEKNMGALPADTIVRIGAWSLTSQQFEQRLKLLKEGLPDFDADKPGNKESVLNELIRQQLLVKDAEDQGIGEKKEITEAVEDFKRTLLVQELANQLTKDIVATEKEAKEYYDQNKALFVTPIEWTAREAVVADEVTAKNMLVQVLQGGDFAEIAKAQSKGKTAAQGGVLPAFKKAPFDAMQTAIANLDAGGTSAVFKGPEGFYLVKIDDKKGGDTKSFESVKKDLVSGLTLRKQQEAILDHINEVASKIKVEINKELIGSDHGK